MFRRAVFDCMFWCIVALLLLYFHFKGNRRSYFPETIRFVIVAPDYVNVSGELDRFDAEHVVQLGECSYLAHVLGEAAFGRIGKHFNVSCDITLEMCPRTIAQICRVRKENVDLFEEEFRRKGFSSYINDPWGEKIK